MRGEENCGSCKFFRRNQLLQPAGVCRAQPPQAMMVGLGKNPENGQQFPIVNSYWPQIGDGEWCGAWRIRPAMGAEIDLSKLDAEALEGNA